MPTEGRQDGDGTDERTKPPFLRRVRIQGYKSIARCDVHLQPLTVLVGRNGSGKSNFLDALAFLRDVMGIGLSEAVKRRGGWTSIVCRFGNTQTILFELEASFICGRLPRLVNGAAPKGSAPAGQEEVPSLEGHKFTARYSLELFGGDNHVPKIRKESLYINDQVTNAHAEYEVEECIVSRSRSKSDSYEPIPLRHSTELLRVFRPDWPLLSVLGDRPLIDLADGLRLIRCYNFHPESIRRLQKSDPNSLLEGDGSNLPSVLESLEKREHASFERVRDYLAIITETVEHFTAVHYGDYETVAFHLRHGPGEGPLKFDAASMSDGTLRALAALVAAFQIHLPMRPSVVGIEEPESSLHPAATRALVDALQEATGHTQLLLTTHSGDLLADRDINPLHVLVVRMRDGQTQIAPVDPASREIVRQELYTLADLQRMGQLELDESDLERQAGTTLQGKEG